MAAKAPPISVADRRGWRIEKPHKLSHWSHWRHHHPKGTVKKASFPYLPDCNGWYAYPATGHPVGPFPDLRSAKVWIEGR